MGENFIFPWKFADFENRTLWTLKLKTYTLYIDEILHTFFSRSADVHIEIWSFRGQYLGGKLNFSMKICRFWESYFVNTKTHNLYIVHSWFFAYLFLTIYRLAYCNLVAFWGKIHCSMKIQILQIIFCKHYNSKSIDFNFCKLVYHHMQICTLKHLP